MSLGTRHDSTSIADAADAAARHAEPGTRDHEIEPSESFAWFLAPLEPTEFFASVLGRLPRLVQGKADRFSHLLPWDELNRILQQHHMDWPRLRLFKDGRDLPKESFLRYFKTKSGMSVPELNLDAMNRQLAEGAMLVVDAVDEAHEPITQLVRMMERSLGERIQANAYAGWYVTRGFDTHWDDHDVFVLQVAGSKRWRVFAPVVQYPLQQGRVEQPGEPHWTGTLTAGDLLYIPRGWPHDAVPTGEPTLHLTLSVFRRTGFDLATWLLERLRDQEIVRADLPRFGSLEERLRYLRSFQDALSLAVREISLDAYFEQDGMRASARPRLSLPWSAMPASRAIPNMASLTWLPPRGIELHVHEAEVEFTTFGKKYAFGRAAEPILTALTSAHRCRFSELCADVGLPRAAVERTVLKLASAGLVAIAEH